MMQLSARAKANRKKMSKLAQRDGGWVCHYCGKKLLRLEEVYRDVYDERGTYVYTTVDPSYGDHPTIDHIIPKSHGGQNKMSNYVLACKSCNSSKGAKVP